MPHLTILGLGPGEWRHLTLEAAQALDTHTELWLRTRHHPLVTELPAHLTVNSFDTWYDEADDFATLYARIAVEVVRLAARPEGVLYAVPGHPFVGETTVAHITRLAREAAIPLRVIEGLSFIEPTLALVGADALDGLQVADATLVAQHHYPPLDADRPALVAQLYSRLLASEVKLTLLELFPPDHPVTLVHAAGTAQADAATVSLHELDQRDDFAFLTSLWIPPLPHAAGLPTFQEIVAHLRAPDGCPWDQEQDHHTLRGAVLEEAYEVVDAIERESDGDLREELGDLLLMVVMHAQIAQEEGRFGMADVIGGIAEKLVRRHPHVFASLEVSGTEEVLQNWEAIKADERTAKGESSPRDPFDEVPLALPALPRAQKITKRAAKGGWPRPDPADALAVWQRAPGNATLGDLLLTLVAYAGNTEAETALREATARLVADQRSAVNEDH